MEQQQIGAILTCCMPEVPESVLDSVLRELAGKLKSGVSGRNPGCRAAEKGKDKNR